MKKAIIKLAAFTASLTLMISGMSIMPVMADSVPVITIGADLSEEQRNRIFEFFGADPSDTMVVEINNTQERQYLEGLVSDDIIGTRTLSCSYIMPTSSGGLIVKTANLTYVDENMIANALLTAGVENCQVLATAPFKVSGTGALTGILTSYEKSSGEKLSEDKKSTATQELIVTGDIIEELVTEEEQNSTEKKDDQSLTEEYIFRFLNELKSEAVNGNLSEETAKELLDKYLKEYGIELSEQTYSKLLDYLKSFSALSYKGKFEDKLSSLTDRISEGFNIDFKPNIGNININVNIKEGLNAFEKFWGTLKNWLCYTFNFGGIKIDTGAIRDKAQNIFDNINTDIINYDIIPEELSEELRDVME